jgi:hypothetical protein
LSSPQSYCLPIRLLLLKLRRRHRNGLLLLRAKQIAASRALTEKVIKTLSMGKTPHALIFTKTGKGYVKDRGRTDLTAINGNTFNVIKTISLPTLSFQLALISRRRLHRVSLSEKHQCILRPRMEKIFRPLNDAGHATKGFRTLHEGLIHDEKNKFFPSPLRLGTSQYYRDCTCDTERLNLFFFPFYNNERAFPRFSSTP